MATFLSFFFFGEQKYTKSEKQKINFFIKPLLIMLFKLIRKNEIVDFNQKMC